MLKDERLPIQSGMFPIRRLSRRFSETRLELFWNACRILSCGCPFQNALVLFLINDSQTSLEFVRKPISQKEEGILP